MKRKVFVGITGASGVGFGIALIEYLSNKVETHISISKGGLSVLEHEVLQVNGGSIPTFAKYDKCQGQYMYTDMEETTKSPIFQLSVNQYIDSDVSSGPASGSFKISCVVVLPCSMDTLAKIACGISDTIILRAVDVCLKQRKQVVLCTRETPLNKGHIENMLRCTDKGCTIMPIEHAFYSDLNIVYSPTEEKSLSALQYFNHIVDNFCGRVLDTIGIDEQIAYQWGI